MQFTISEPYHSTSIERGESCYSFHFYQFSRSFQHRTKDLSCQCFPPLALLTMRYEYLFLSRFFVETSSNTKAESEKQELAAFTSLVRHNFSPIVSPVPPSLPLSDHPHRVAIHLLSRHLFSAAIFRIRYLRSQLQISGIPQSGSAA